MIQTTIVCVKVRAQPASHKHNQTATATMPISDGDKTPGADGACERGCEDNASGESTAPSCPPLPPVPSQEPATQKQNKEKPVDGKKRKKASAQQVTLTIGDWIGMFFE